ncbi:DUF1987 domain-containing protein [Paracrocinitomix mangrovi]|uniref:DUF1987 domain-containing protein n=1 Tax=Paracrocinitomix mangrovi TaxID=2862509 RepID=UPI001C8E40DE|nr:DUF1987 domain-containing protein [Paracrocinitomix mangrovi]UKN01212.1 DUF1987 domain-containing protein [Paracrocinitomix mangrovi]
MKDISVELSELTPSIQSDLTNHKLSIEGISIPENSKEFYKPVKEWITEYNKSSNDALEVNLKLDYFNTSSSFCILEILKMLNSASGKKQVYVNWLYEADDEDMKEAGEEFQNIVGDILTIKEVA